MNVSTDQHRDVYARSRTDYGTLLVLWDAAGRSGGMRYLFTVLYDDERRQNVTIRCKTRQSALRLFGNVWLWHRPGHREHPFMRAVV